MNSKHIDLEIEELIAFRDELRPYCEWDHGAELIAEDERADYLKSISELTDDNWLFKHIDWESAVREYFQFDWHYAELRGVTYYVRVI